MTPNNHISLDNHPPPDWDSFVASHPRGTVYHTSHWKEILERSFPHIHGRILAMRDQSGRLIAGMPLYLVDSWLTGKRLVSIPFATACHPLTTNMEQTHKLLDQTIQAHKKYRCKYTEIRLTQKNRENKIAHQKFKEVTRFKYHFIKLYDPEKLKYKFSRTAVRGSINKAKKKGFHIVVGDSMTMLNQFYSLYTQARQQLGLPPHPYSFFLNIMEQLGQIRAGIILLAFHGRQLAAGILAFRYRGVFSMEYGGVAQKFRQDCATHFLYWKAICYAYDMGDRLFDFGRTAAANTGLLEFKRRWGCTEADITQLFYPPQREAGLSPSGFKYRAARKLIAAAPSSLSRALGSFLYRHMG